MSESEVQMHLEPGLFVRIQEVASELGIDESRLVELAVRHVLRQGLVTPLECGEHKESED